MVETADAPNQSGTGDAQDMAPAKRTPSPAFQFYPKDFLLSRRVNRMSFTERGIYITLLSMCWIDGGVTADLDRLGTELGLKPSKFRSMWDRGALHECFSEKSGRLVNVRIEEERRKQIAYRDKQATAAALRWKKLPDGSVSVPSHSVSDRSQRTSDSAETLRDSTPTVLTFPAIGKGPKSWALTEAQVGDWLVAYPGVDVRGECHKALAWVNANGAKTARGMPAFLVRWLNNTTNRGPRAMAFGATGTNGRGRTGAPAPGKYDGFEEHD